MARRKRKRHDFAAADLTLRAGLLHRPRGGRGARWSICHAGRGARTTFVSSDHAAIDGAVVDEAMGWIDSAESRRGPARLHANGGPVIGIRDVHDTHAAHHLAAPNTGATPVRVVNLDHAGFNDARDHGDMPKAHVAGSREGQDGAGLRPLTACVSPGSVAPPFPPVAADGYAGALARVRHAGNRGEGGGSLTRGGALARCLGPPSGRSAGRCAGGGLRWRACLCPGIASGCLGGLRPGDAAKGEAQGNHGGLKAHADPSWILATGVAFRCNPGMRQLHWLQPMWPIHPAIWRDLSEVVGWHAINQDTRPKISEARS